MLRPWSIVRRSTGPLSGLALWLAADFAHADPQASVGLTLGAAGEGDSIRPWKRTAFHLGLHGDLIFGRNRNADFGIGPYAEVFTHAFDTLQFGGGISGLLPVIDAFPIIVSAGAYGRWFNDSVEPGIAGSLFWGSRSYNYHSTYVLSGGLLAQMRYGLGPSKENSIAITAQVDLGILAMPILFLISAVRGTSSEAASLP